MAERDDILDEIEELALSVRGSSMSNPRYFAECLTETVSLTPETEMIALEELREAMRRIVQRQP